MASVEQLPLAGDQPARRKPMPQAAIPIDLVGAAAARRYRGGVASVLGLPDTVNEKAARVVAGGVAIIALVTLITGWP